MSGPPPFANEPCPHEDDPASCTECAFDDWPRLVVSVLVFAFAISATVLILKASDMYTSAQLDATFNQPKPVAP